MIQSHLVSARAISVSRLSHYLKKIIVTDPELKDVVVRGEIANLRLPSASSKQIYFSLKDENAVLACVVWPGDISKIPPLREGSRVILQGSVDVYPRAGRYQLAVRAAALDGDGAVYLALEELRQRLHGQGLFAIERKRPLPKYPFRIALVSSATAQGANDFRRISLRRSPHIQILLVETPVQGENAGEQVAAAIERAASLGVDCIAIVRGGGASEDLWAFNHEAVVRAIVAACVPVITGIGHESDVTLADHAADVRAATPTDAANRLPALVDIARELGQLVDQLRARTREGVGRRRERLAGLGQRLERRSPAAQIADRRRRISLAHAALERAHARFHERSRERLLRVHDAIVRSMAIQPERKRARLQLALARLDGHNPEAILQLGYAIVRIDGRAVRDVSVLGIGMMIEARLAHGTLGARVETLEHDGTHVS